MDSGSCATFLAPRLIHSVAFRKWPNCGVLRGAECTLRSISFLWSRGGFLEENKSSAPCSVRLCSLKKIQSSCLCSLHKNWVQESRVLVSLSSTKQREWSAEDLWGSQLERAVIKLKDELALLKERWIEPLRHMGSHHETNYRLTHQLIVCALVQ